ncbi:hypothetical protein MPPM_4744 [Methylorubrum populi]|uniref:Uncharacterized protein n=1 Tax=Methylorubrum populi TaxID=223967 RepID=A0A160PIQ1_9HYPH|nr:hypothetical protein MPPM_4744 [Methylorubrum populi]
MTWLGWGPPAESLAKLDAAIAGNVAAQKAVQRAGDAAAASAQRQRREAVIQRRQARAASHQLRKQALQTSEVRALVDDMLRSFEASPERQKDGPPC